MASEVNRAAKILVVDDEIRMRRIIKDFLEAAGHKTVEASDGKQALEIFLNGKKDISLVVMDIMMPEMSGWELCREIRRISSVPIIMLTALSQESDELTGFDVGADEYIVKPFSPRVFVARVEGLLRRAGGSGDGGDVIELDGIRIDPKAHSVFVDGKEVYLSLKEYDLLLYLVRNCGQTLSREKILDNVWNYDYYGNARTIDTHMTKLRRKLAPYGDRLQTVRGVGYRFQK